MKKHAGATIRRGSGNLFADLGYADPDTHLLKAQLVSRMHDIIRGRKLTQTDVARLTGFSQPDVSRVLKGQFRDVSVDRIMRVLSRLGCEIDIVVKPSGSKAATPVIRYPVSA
ncbi:MAG: XRE family transcriptional regulator [Proteobacteria bacterium]|nr:XRE family transcriptional regulator [Pseudomonadota bacterium]